MARDILAKGPNFVHPEKPSAVGSRNSLNRNDRDEYEESKVIVDEEVDKILNHIHIKLPPEVLEKLDVMGTLKSKLHNYFNQGFQNMLNRYLVTMEDEMGKKVRDLVDKEEYRMLNRYSPREIAVILDQIGGEDKFNTGEIEKAVVNMYGHLHGHIQRGVNELETHTNSLLREKTDVGAFVRGENAYAIAKCSFSDNKFKPKTVTDLKLSINILDSELISPIYHYKTPISTIIKDVVAKHIHELIDKEINSLNEKLMDEGKETLNETEAIFERFRVLDNYVDDESVENENAKRYNFIAKKFLDSVEGLGAEIEKIDYDAMQIRENVKKIIDKENIRNRGYNTAINSLTAILDTSKMGYQHIENFKNLRECIIREYQDEDVTQLPDERYKIKIVYYDSEQLDALRASYSEELDGIEQNILNIWDVIEKIYQENKAANGINDWETVKEKYSNKPQNSSGGGFFSPAQEEDEGEEDSIDKEWDELSFVEVQPTRVESENPDYEYRIEKMQTRLDALEDRLELIYKYEYPEKRRVLSDRIEFVTDKFNEFKTLINPYHIQPGLLVDIDIVSIKRKRTTMMSMANVLNEFLFTVSKGFSDAAFASFSRRRSTVREDIAQEFTSGSAE